VRRRKLKKVGVLEFLQPLGRTERLASANLPAYCGERVRQALQELAGSAYVVLSAEDMRKASRGVVVEAVGNPEAMRKLGKEGGGLDGVVLGTLRRRGAVLQVQCDLVATADGSSLVTPSGTLPLSEGLFGDLGNNFDNRERPAGTPHDSKVRQHVEERAQEGHPLLNKDFPFRLEVWSIQVRPGEEITARTPRVLKKWLQVPVEAGPPGSGKKRIELIVPAREGEIFEVRVANKAAHRVAMALLVDGINTLGQKREPIERAWSWVLEGKKDYAIDPSFA
jgi:hypothetical protein